MRRGGLLLALALNACAHVPAGPPRDGEAAAVYVVWHDVYGRTDRPPVVHWRRGSQLDCTDPHSGKAGFRLIDGACREGQTLSPLEVTVADHGEPFSETALAHELEHASQARRLVFDPLHLTAAFRAGGEVDQANDALREAGL